MYEITNRTAAPYRTVCYILTEWADGTFSRGSGVVVGVNDVLTANHVVYSAVHGGVARSITIYPGADTNPIIVEPYGHYTDVGLIARRAADWDTDGDGLLTQSEAQYDLALLGLYSPIGNTVGWSGLTGRNGDFSGAIVGYPSEIYGGTGMMTESVFADSSSSYGVWEIGASLGAGASGGPLFYTDSTGSYVAGVLSSGSSVNSNYAALFGPGNWDWLQEAMASNDRLLTGSGGGGGGGGGTTDDFTASTATAGRLALGGTATGRLELATDEDWFLVQITTPATYTFTAKGVDGAGGTLADPVIQLYDASGTSVDWNDDASGSTLDASLTATLSTGNYYVGVWTWTANGTGGTYTVAASAPPSGGGGTGGNNGSYVGTAGPDTLVGTAANETFLGSGGNDLINGMGGFDEAWYAGTRSEYRLNRSGSSVTVNDTLGLDGLDTLSNIERVTFEDMNVNLAIGANSRTISTSGLKLLEELYVAFFNRVPDADGLSYWIDQYRGGTSINSIANSFYGAALAYPSLTGYTSAMSNGDFVNLVYRNVLGRANGADADGFNYWTAELAKGTARGTLVTTIISTAHSFKGRADYGWVADLLDNKAYVANLFAVEMGLSYNDPAQSVSKGMAIAAAVTPTGTAAAVTLIGVSDGFSTLA